MWSFYFVLLEFLGISLPWGHCKKEDKMDEVKAEKQLILSMPERFLWKGCEIQEVRNIFYSIKSLKYADRPDYEFIREEISRIVFKKKGDFEDGVMKMLKELQKEKDTIKCGNLLSASLSRIITTSSNSGSSALFKK